MKKSLSLILAASMIVSASILPAFSGTFAEEDAPANSIRATYYRLAGTDYVGGDGTLTQDSYESRLGYEENKQFDDTIDALLDASILTSTAAGVSALRTLGSDYYIIKWTGTLTAKEAGTYTIVGRKIDNGFTMFVDDEKVYEYWGASHWFAEDTDRLLSDEASFTLEAGQTAKVEMYYLELGGGDECIIHASTDGGITDVDFSELFTLDLTEEIYMTGTDAANTLVGRGVGTVNDGNGAQCVEENFNYASSIDRLLDVMVEGETKEVASFADALINEDSYVILYSGTMTPMVSGNYVFGADIVDNGFYLELDNKVAYEMWAGYVWNDNGGNVYPDSLYLEAGVAYPFTAAFLETNGGQNLALNYSIDGGETVSGLGNGFTFAPSPATDPDEPFAEPLDGKLLIERPSEFVYANDPTNYTRVGIVYFPTVVDENSSNAFYGLENQDYDVRFTVAGGPQGLQTATIPASDTAYQNMMFNRLETDDGSYAFRFNAEDAGIELSAGYQYTVLTELIDTVDGLVAYAFAPQTATSPFSTQGEESRTPETDPDPNTSALTKLTVEPSSIRGKITGTDDDLTYYNENEGLSNLFDNLYDGKTGTGESNVTFIWSYPNAVTVSTIVLYTGGDTSAYSSRNPISWKMYGSNNNGESWKVIDVVNYAGMGAEDFAPFGRQISNPGSYQTYKIEFVTGGGFQLTEIETYSENSEDEFVIDSPEDLIAFANAANANSNYMKKQTVRVTADLDMTGYDFTPIRSGLFVLDFQGHTVSNLNLTRTVSGDASIGLLADQLRNDYFNAGIINVKLKDCSLNVTNIGEGEVYVGGVVGYADRAFVTDVELENVTITVVGAANVGSVIGRKAFDCYDNGSYVDNMNVALSGVTVNAPDSTVGIVIGRLNGDEQDTTHLYINRVTGDITVEGSVNEVTESTLIGSIDDEHAQVQEPDFVDVEVTVNTEPTDPDPSVTEPTVTTTEPTVTEPPVTEPTVTTESEVTTAAPTAAEPTTAAPTTATPTTAAPTTAAPTTVAPTVTTAPTTTANSGNKPNSPATGDVTAICAMVIVLVASIGTALIVKKRSILK